MMLRLFILSLWSLSLFAQDGPIVYEVDLTRQNDAFNVTVTVPQLSENDAVFSFVSYAPGVHQPLDFGRFVKLFKVYDELGNELLTNKIATNDFEILEPAKVSKIVYEIDDTFDMDTQYHPIYPMSGTGICEDYTILNSHGVFGYFKGLKDRPIKLKLELNGSQTIGTALNLGEDGYYEVASYYHLTDSPILIGRQLSYASTDVGDIQVEAYVHSPSGNISADMVLEQASDILHAAHAYIGYSPVKRYTFLMYFSSHEDMQAMPVFRNSGALEHALSSTYALPDMPQYLPLLKNVIAHEFMHILSPLHLHSEVLAHFDYSRPVSEDHHVWLYEGVTEWVSYIMQVKSGIKTAEDYLKYLSEKVNHSQEYNADYSLTRISHEWSTDEGNKQYGNIYQLGALTAAMLDIKLLQLSNGKQGLREVYLALIQKYGKDNPFDNATFFDTLVEMTYPEISDFIDNHIKNNRPFDFETEMAPLGIRYYERRPHPDQLPTMGLVIRPNTKGQPEVVSLSSDYQGTKVTVGDIITHIDGTALNQSTYRDLTASIKKMKVGDAYRLDILREGKEMTIDEELYAKYDNHVFEFDPGASADAIRLRQKVTQNKD
ncbi:PDZ domain-containing protein [Aestuariivivens sediminicola]|uniref:M61 family metallopeptidase n=1 Tax=Aestuariivivens sediminicola TaxID=2913560 RepID=UPI001F591997|nr:PDZ domain-containing protein [Aestuariivivens sediminicola]